MLGVFQLLLFQYRTPSSPLPQMVFLTQWLCVVSQLSSL